MRMLILRDSVAEAMTMCSRLEMELIKIVSFQQLMMILSHLSQLHTTIWINNSMSTTYW